MKGFVLKVVEVYKLNEDYDNIFINNTAHYKPSYTKLNTISRTINKTHYEDIFAIEPQSYYYIEFDNTEYLKLCKPHDFDSILKESGLILQLDKKSCRLYIYNTNRNVIYIQKGSILLKKVFNNG